MTGLLTEVFLQLSFQSNLPPSDTLTLMDWIFNLSFLIIFLIIIECIYIRKLYYRLLLDTERLKDEIVLSNLQSQTSSTNVLASSSSGSPQSSFHGFSMGGTDEDVVAKAKQTKRHKEKIKRRIRKFEKVFFVAFLIAGSFMLLIISLLGKYA